MKKKIIMTLLASNIILGGCEKKAEPTTTISMKQTMMENPPKANDENKKPVAEGEMILEDFDGNPYKLSDSIGKTTYVKFWASWCPVCLDSLGEFDKFAKQANDKAAYEVVTVVAPGFSGEKEKEEFKDWFTDLGHDNIKVVFDTTGDFVREFKIRSAPTNIFIDKEGKVLQTVPGELDNQTLNKLLSIIEQGEL